MLTIFTVVPAKRSLEKTLCDDRWIRAISYWCNNGVCFMMPDRNRKEGPSENARSLTSLSAFSNGYISFARAAEFLTAEKATSYVCLIRKHSTQSFSVFTFPAGVWLVYEFYQGHI